MRNTPEIPDLRKSGEFPILRRTVSILETVDTAVNYSRRAYEFWQKKFRWTVSITSNDRLYDVALKWFLSDEADTKPPRNIKATYVYGHRRSSRDFGDDIVSPSTSRRRESGRVELLFNETNMRNVLINGQKITIQLQRPEQASSIDPGEERSFRSVGPDVLNFYARSRDGQQAVVDYLRQLAADSDKRKPALYLLDTWGSWSRRDDLPQRQLESVSLRAGQMERIRDDVQSFLGHEMDYVRRGMPYHRGYMLHGPPGTGKTSIVRALAAHFGLDLWYAPLGDLDKDTSLMSLINQVQPGSILLLEDVDVYHATRERDDESRGASLAGLLNALDGVATPHGLITFMTTNDVDVIDKALLRPGRVDIIEEVGYPDKDQIARLFNSWYDTKLDPSEVNHIKWTGTTAELTELFKQNLNSEAEAWAVLQKRKPVAEERSVKPVPTSGGKK